MEVGGRYGSQGEQIETASAEPFVPTPVVPTVPRWLLEPLLGGAGVAEGGAVMVTGRPKWVKVSDKVSISLPPEPRWVVVT